MPRSRHRRKAGAKSPIRRKPPREMPPSPEEVVWRKFADAYKRPFHRQWPDSDAGYMLDIVFEAMLDTRTATFHAANKGEICQEFLEPFQSEEMGESGTWAPEQADAALAVLIEQNMVVVEGEQISAHPRFADVLSLPVAHVGADGGQ